MLPGISERFPVDRPWPFVTRSYLLTEVVTKCLFSDDKNCHRRVPAPPMRHVAGEGQCFGFHHQLVAVGRSTPLVKALTATALREL